MDTRFASRKFVLSCAVLALAWTAFAFKQISAVQILDFATWVLGLYMAGNVGDTAAGRLK